MTKYLAIAALVILAACSDADTAKRAVEAQGFTDVVITGYTMWGCSEDDTFRTGFYATGVNGVRVEGVVCSGWLKGATVRVW